ncbi:MAG: Gfo/Idh/MocA family oxidoreductase [Chloroflexota bacterium]
MNKLLRVGIMGLGQRGLQHFRALWKLQASGLAQIVGLCDAFEENIQIEKLKSTLPTSESSETGTRFELERICCTISFDELLAQNLDVLYVCIPPNYHNGEVIRATQAGIHLFVEKPMSLYLDEALAMQKAIDDAGVFSVVGFQQRFDTRHEAVKYFLEGDVAEERKQPVMACYTFHAPFESHNVKHMHTEASGGPINRVWTANAAWSGMTVVEGGIHPLDLWRYWFGDVIWVQADYIHRPPEAVIDGADNPYAYSAKFGFESGVVGVMTLSRLRRVFHTYADHQLLYTEGRLSIEADGVHHYHYAGELAGDSSGGSSGDSSERRSKRLPNFVPQLSEADVRTILEMPPAVDATWALSRNFLLAIANDDRTQIRSPFDDAMNSLAAVLGANVSDALNGQRVEIAALLTDSAYAQFRSRPV